MANKHDTCELPQQQEKEKYITKTDLKNRGWTDGAIAKFLGNPDLTKRNPHYRSASPMQLFSITRIEVVEATPEFQDWKIKQQSRKRKIQEKKQSQQQSQIENIQELRNKYPTVRQPEIVFQFSQEFKNSLLENEWNIDEIQQAESTIEEMLKRSDWYPAQRFVYDFHRPLPPNTTNSDSHIAELANSIEQDNWKGIPVVHFEDTDELKPIFLMTGAHRLRAIVLLLEQKRIDDFFLIPVFNLNVNWNWYTKQLPKRDKKRVGYLGLDYLTLKELSRYSPFFYVTTGIDNW